jgi:hypothetical protein
LPGHGGEYRVEIGLAVFLDKALGGRRGRGLTEKKDDFGRRTHRQTDLRLQGAARIEACAITIG